MIQHDGKKVPVFPESWDADSKEPVWIAWDDQLKGSGISTSAWVLPSGWTGTSEQVSQAVTDSDGNSYTAANSVTLETTVTSGIHRITNRVVFADGRQDDRSVDIYVRPL